MESGVESFHNQFIESVSKGSILTELSQPMVPSFPNQHDESQVWGGRLYQLQDGVLDLEQPSGYLDGQENALINLLLTVEIAQYPNFLAKGLYILNPAQAGSSPAPTHLLGQERSSPAAPLKPFQNRDLTTLRALFERDDIDEITDNIHARLKQLYPEPCWDESPYDFLREFL